MNAHDICTAIRELKPSPEEAEALLVAIANNLGFVDHEAEGAINEAADVVCSFIGNRNALAYEKQAERDAKGPI